MTIRGLIEVQCRRKPDAVAIGDLERPPLTYGELLTHLDGAVRALDSLGVGRGDRVGLALPNGADMATAFLAAAEAAVAAPLKPDATTEEFEFSLGDLGVTAVIVQAGVESRARAVARARGIAVIELSTRPDFAGTFELDGLPRAPEARTGRGAASDDVALVLYTSGSTARPKRVPLTHANVCAAAVDYASGLGLTESDRCLSVMPLFHYHGLLVVSISSFTVGAAVIYAPGFDASAFFDWMARSRPTWYSVSPTVHQAILGRASAHRDVLARCPLRFIRSGTAALPADVLTEMERLIGVPVVDTYAMTEAAPIAMTPLPPRRRRPGAVGVPLSSGVAILAPDGRLQPRGETGEIVVRGPAVFHGYEDDPEANRAAFVNGWFRTGDEGRIDEDGYVYVTGRLKEMISRGGEKVAPLEVDEILRGHPAVSECAAFAIPDSRLGEDIAAAVVLRDGYAATERELREFVAARVAHFKVPRHVILVSQIPRSAVGKPARAVLAETLAPKIATASPARPFVAPGTELERAVAAMWSELLAVDGIALDDSFLELGGDSLLAMRFLARAVAEWGVEVSIVQFFGAPTVRAVAAILAAT